MRILCAYLDLKQITINIKCTMEYTKDVYIPIAFDYIRYPIMAIQKNTNL